MYTLRITGPEGIRVQTLAPGEHSLGRQPGNDILLPNREVSRRHALLACTPQGCAITDLGSSNGTYLEGKKLAAYTPYPIALPAHLKIGPFQLRLEAAGERAARAAALPEEAAPPKAEPAPKEATPPRAAGKGAAPKKARKSRKTAPPSRPPAPPSPPKGAAPPQMPAVPEGLEIHSQQLLRYLPAIYHTDFMSRFLGLFESILLPIEWTIDNFDLYLDALTSPADFLPWWENLMGLAADASWSVEQRRALLREAHHLFARRGTPGALSRLLEIYTGSAPRIRDTDPDLPPHTFVVQWERLPEGVNRALLEALIATHKPAHTDFRVEFPRP
ncbi:MAG TPA: FHA domain-containing protein [Chloroflexi bacterium]|nr:FHA domain-containing protein [Chloroflexota bacterium]